MAKANPTVQDLMQQATALHRAGDTVSAARLYQQVIRQSPRLADAHHLLGLILFQDGRNRQALQAIARAIALKPEAAPFHGNLGLVQQAAGETAAAVASFQQALALDPGYHAARLNFATALAMQERSEEALVQFRVVLDGTGATPSLLARIAELLRRLGRLEEAIAHYRRALELQPEDAGLLAALAQTQHLAGDEEDALENYEQALRLRPTFTEARINRATILRDLGQAEAALAGYEQVRRDAPDAVEAIAGMVNTYERMGEPERAWQVMEPHLARHGAHPLIAVARAGLAGQFEPAETVEAVLQTLSRQDGLPSLQRQQALFALARLLERDGRYPDAFRCFAEANGLTRSAFDSQAHEARCAAIQRSYANPAGLPDSGLDDQRPLFIVGMPRSGTSLVEEILASHAEVHGGGELPALPRLTASEPLATAYPEAVGGLQRADLRRAAERYLQRLDAAGSGSSRITDKLPSNFLHLGLIRQLFPAARIVHISRDPVDTCLSCYQQNFGERLSYTADLATLAAFYGSYSRHMAHWRAVMGDSFMDLRYEDLIADGEKLSRQLVAHAGLPWDPACLRFHENRRFVRTASYQQVRQPIYRDAVGKWRKYERELAPLRQALLAEGVNFAG